MFHVNVCVLLSHCYTLVLTCKVQNCAKCNQKDLTSKRNFSQFFSRDRHPKIDLNLSLDLRRLNADNWNRYRQETFLQRDFMQFLCNFSCVKILISQKRLKTYISLLQCSVLFCNWWNRQNYFNYPPRSANNRCTINKLAWGLNEELKLKISHRSERNKLKQNVCKLFIKLETTRRQRRLRPTIVNNKVDTVSGA